ncbi:putative RNA-directed DNA polymerase [Helianthus annuus]|nr:putative RNA-directed DNA polymerase [Helianthus annuus]
MVFTNLTRMPRFLSITPMEYLCIFLVYVDDIILTGNNTSFMNNFVTLLSKRFSLKDLGDLHHFLGIEVISTTHGMFLSQHRHINDLLTNFNMDGAKDVATPLSSSEALSPDDGSSRIDPTTYQKIIGSLQYLAFTRPDVSFAVNKLSQYMHAPTTKHMQALKRVMRYLKGTIHRGLFLKKSKPVTITAFADSDWGGIRDGGRSTTAYLIYLGSNIVSWKSTRQKTVSRSSTEAEYKALANAAAEVSWVQNLLKELHALPSTSPNLYCDNMGATYLCSNPVYH